VQQQIVLSIRSFCSFPTAVCTAAGVVHQIALLPSNNSLCSCRYHNLAKQLSYYLYFLFFSFILDLLHRREYRKVSHHKCHTSHSHSHMMSHDGSHNKCRKVVHRPCSSCISNIENLTGTLLSSLCQLLNKEQLALF